MEIVTEDLAYLKIILFSSEERRNTLDSRSLLRTLTIGNDSILVPYIDRYLAAGQFPDKLEMTLERNKPSDPYFHPSGDCFTSPRDLYLQKKGELTYPKPTAALRKTFDCGHLWHMYLQGILQEIGFLTKENTEKKVLFKHKDFIGAGTVDCLDVLIPQRGSWLVDIKTMRKDEFEAGANKYTYMKWEAQVNCYMDWTNRDQAMILAISKDSPHMMREYKIQRNQELLDDIYGRWAFTAKCLELGILPDEGIDVPEDPLLLNPGDSVTDVIVAEKDDKVS